MYCFKCGKENTDDAIFCVSCGQKLVSDRTTKSNNPASNVLDTITNKKSNIRFSDNDILNEIKKFVTSPLVLIAVIAFSLSIIFTIFTAGDTFTDTIENVYRLMGSSEFSDFLAKEGRLAVGILDIISTVVAFIIMLPSIVICIGLWVTVYSAFNKKSDSMTTGGLTAIRVINIIDIVFAVIGIVLVLIITLGMTASERYEVTFLFYILVGTFFVSNGFRIYYLIKINDTIDCFIYSVQAQYPAEGMSNFVTVMLFISGGFQALGALFGGTLASLCSATATILFAIIIVQYKSLTQYMRKTYYSPEIDSPLVTQTDK